MTALLVGLALAAAGAAAQEPAPSRRIAIRAPAGFSQELERLGGSLNYARRRGIALDVGPEEKAVPPGWEVVRLSALPPSETFRSTLRDYPIRLEENGFSFDGRSYRSSRDGIALADPRCAEILILGNSEQAALSLLRLSWRQPRAGYHLRSGELSKTGRFRVERGLLAIDRASDRDGIAGRDRFYTSLQTERHGGVTWRFGADSRAALARWEPVLRRFLAGPPPATGIRVDLFPDPAIKGLYTGSSRPADASREGAGVTVEIDVSAPAEPDLISPVLAGAALAAREPSLFDRPALLAAAGARAHGRWWGRDVAGFAAFTRAADVAPTVEQVLSSDEQMSPVLGIGAAASWLEAGVRLEGEAAVRRALAGPEPPLAAALRRWSRAASAGEPSAPPRRRLPERFLCGVSYAMSNSIEGGYASPRSFESLRRIRALPADSVSVMPFGFMRSAHGPEMSFIHRHPAGETDEGTVRAVADARRLGMTAMIKPQLWLAGGTFVGAVAMKSETDWGSWFDAYRRFIVHNAIVAEASGAALFCVGTELAGTEERARDWRRTIAAVRLATGAPLLYASNWAAGAEKVPFWDALDAIGADFYDPLSSNPNASDAELENGARAAARPLDRLAKRFQKPVILAEAGYPPLAAAWVAPHEEDSARPVKPEDAARAVAAVFRALGGQPWWRGVYWWKAFSDGRPARPGERDFNFLGTPAEKAITAGFQSIARASAR